MADRLLLFSTDGHAGAPTEAYRDYIPAAYQEDFGAFLGRHRQVLAAMEAAFGSGQRHNLLTIFSEPVQDGWLANAKVTDGSRNGAWDRDIRFREMRGEGFAGEAVFFGPQMIECQMPFGGGLGGLPYPATAEQLWVGHHAYNRWLADFVDPACQAGIAVVPTLGDVDRIVEEIGFAAGAGLRGVQLPSDEDGIPLLYHERYEPVWRALVEHDMTLAFHSGQGAIRCQDRNGGMAFGAGGISAASGALAAIEVHWHSHRPLWHLLVGLVFEKFPALRVVFTEAQADWVPDTLRYLDGRLTGVGARRLAPLWELSQQMSLKPSEYWRRQCFVAASSATAHELSLRHEYGVETLTFGADYPHIEGTWPNTLDWLRLICHGIPEEEARMILGANACRAFGMDPAKLQALASQHGPTPDDILATPASFASDAIKWKVETAALGPAISRP